MANPWDGLRLKSKEARGGGRALDGTYGLAQYIQQDWGNNLKYFTAFNDAYHHSERYFAKKGSRNPGAHGAGLAMDIALANPKQSAAMLGRLRAHLAERGMREGRDYKIIDEYAKPSKGATGGHIDFRWTSAAAAARYAGGKGQAKGATMPEASGQEAALPASAVLPAPDLSVPGVQTDSGNVAVRAETVELETPKQQQAAQMGDWFSPEGLKRQQEQQQVLSRSLESLKIKPLEFDDGGSTARRRYEKQLAQAFGEYPEGIETALPNYIDDLVKSIYEAA